MIGSHLLFAAPTFSGKGMLITAAAMTVIPGLVYLASRRRNHPDEDKSIADRTADEIRRNLWDDDSY